MDGYDHRDEEWWLATTSAENVFCPFADDGVCPADCMSNAERACVNGLVDE